MIRKVGTKFVIYSSEGKRLGEYPSRKQAEDRLKQIEMFKHMEEAFKAKGKK